MDTEFTDRLASFKTTLKFANGEDVKGVWENQIPKNFGSKLATAGATTTALEDWAAQQSASIVGEAEEKELEEEELEDIAYTHAQALVEYFLDKEEVAAAEPFRRSESWWSGLRDQGLLDRSQEVIEAGLRLTTGPGAAVLAEQYGISAASVALLVKERGDYEGIVNGPASVRSGRAGLTRLLRSKFKPVSLQFRGLDRLVVQFKQQPGGADFVSGWFVARQVINTGGRQPRKKPPTEPTK